VISTKLDRDPETNRFDGPQARRSLEESLDALGLDRVDLLHLHDPEYAASLDEVTGKDGAITELFRMRDEGLARAVGWRQVEWT
jgi:D-threo-aldose 1-dehydrogenase